ncbi:MAG TPA: PhzF family phenazine biosynthesis protein [Bacteroidota bacterium]|nr:PhzF family phenazine biosynthesis protein [Bacteroidota bacterium]
MRKISFKHVNAFTTEQFSGNPAGVVLDAKGLSESKMQFIAREFALPETAFVLPPGVRGADIQIRWFSPTVEIPLCGHATIGAFHALAEAGLAGMRQNGLYPFKVQTKSGLLKVVVEKKTSGTIVEFHLPVSRFTVVQNLSSQIRNSLGLKSSDLSTKLPVARANYLYVPINSLARLFSMKPDMEALAQVCRAHRWIGVCVFTLQTKEQSSAFHSRFFAPAAGIPEDPVTGSANGPLGVYLHQFALWKSAILPSFTLADGRLEFVGEQGDVLGRKGRVKVRIKVKKGVVDDVSIAGEAVTIFSSDLYS